MALVEHEYQPATLLKNLWSAQPGDLSHEIVSVLTSELGSKTSGLLPTNARKPNQKIKFLFTGGILKPPSTKVSQVQNMLERMPTVPLRPP